MGFDNTFQGNPPSGVPNGPALGLDITTGTLYVSLPQSGKWTKASGTAPFSAISSGTNTTASLVIGSGASLSTSGTGTISATPAGSSGDIQFNSSGSFGGSAAIVTSGGSITIPASQELLVGTTSDVNTIFSWTPATFVASAGTTEQLWFGEIPGNPGYGIVTLASSNGVQGTLGYTHPLNGGSFQIGTFSNHPLLFNTNGNGQMLMEPLHGSLIAGSSTTYSWSSSSSLAANATADTGLSRLGPASVAIGSGSQGQFNGSLKLGNITLTSAAPTVAAAQVGLGSTTAATATAGGGQAALATVLGYLVANVAGTTVKIPYFSA